jgi:hypothetical protein
MRMRPSADPRAPGIYQTFDSVAPPPLSIANTRVTGFVGLTEKGPMNEATRLSNWDEFVETFGHDRNSYLSDSVYGYFRNGGADAWIVRIAHMAPAGGLPDLEHAASGEHIHLDDWDRPALKIRELNERTWSNVI